MLKLKIGLPHKVARQTILYSDTGNCNLIKRVI